LSRFNSIASQNTSQSIPIHTNTYGIEITEQGLNEVAGPFLGKEVGANDHGADLLPRRCQLDILELDLSAISIGIETCNLGANNDDAEVRVHFLNSN
jgi:hypothetical protein